MPRLSERSPLRLALWVCLATLAFACKPKIGDDCKISTDCSAAGDRLCDITAPGGYCTMFNCEPGTCPDDESLCVEFGAQRARAEKCQDKQSPSPYARSFCMHTCDSNSDCRAGYQCADLSTPKNDWDAVLIDKGRGNKACVVPFAEEKTSPGTGGSMSSGTGGGFGDVCVSELPAQASSGGGGGSSAGGSASALGGAGGSAGETDSAGQGGGG
jgi:hypothetical protein